jgi:integrin alpha FG-GAP repeat containing protein 1
MASSRVLQLYSILLLLKALLAKGRPLATRQSGENAFYPAQPVVTFRSNSLSTDLLQDHSKYVSLGDGAGSAIALGDFTRDRYTDLVMCDNANEMRSVYISRWDQQKYRFEAVSQSWNSTAFFSSLSLDSFLGVPKTAFIVNAIPLDANADGSLDILLSIEIDQGAYMGLMVYGNGNGGLRPGPMLPDVNPGMLVMDGDGDLIPDIMFTTTGGQLAFYRNNPPGHFNLILWNPFKEEMTAKESTSNNIHGLEYSQCIPDYFSNSNAFVDLNGDCLADLVISTRNCGMHVWLNKRAATSQLSSTSPPAFWNLTFEHHPSRFVPLSKEVWNRERGDGRAVFADFNGDGTMDIAYPNAQLHHIMLTLNEQPPREFGKLCQEPQDWRMHSYVALPNVVVADTGLGPAIARGAIHIGDYNYDGLVDIMIISGESGTLEMFEGVRTAALDVQYSRPLGRLRRRFGNILSGIYQSTDRVHKTEFRRVHEDVLYRIEDPVAASFIDVDESGRQDLLIVQSHGSRLIANNYRSLGDFEFFKATGVNARADGLHPLTASNQPYVPIAGSTVKISYDGRNGLEQSVCTQCSQASFLQLQSCTCMFGIRNIANYIQEMAIGSGDEIHSWSALMPNAIAIIWRTDGLRHRWRVAYFTMRRGQQMFGVVVVLSTTLVILGASIIYLHTAEKVDERKSRIQLHQFAS